MIVVFMTEKKCGDTSIITYYPFPEKSSPGTKSDSNRVCRAPEKKTKKQKQGFIYRSNLKVGAIRPCGPDIFFVQRNEPLLPDD